MLSLQRIKSTIEATGFKGVGGSGARTVSVWLRADGTSAAGGILVLGFFRK